MPKLKESPPVAAPWKMPSISVGQVVLWSFNPGGRDISPAIVLAVGSQAINVAVHVDGNKDHIFKSGVRHFEDPVLNRMPEYDGGVWSLNPRDILINDLLNSLLEGVTSLEGSADARRPYASAGVPTEE